MNEVSWNAQLIADLFSFTDWFKKSLSWIWLLVRALPCVHVTVSATQFFTFTVKDCLNSGVPLKSKEVLLQLVSQKVLPDLPLLLQAVRKAKGRVSKRRNFIKISWKQK